MDPTTQAHIDPSTLHTSTTNSGTPILTTGQSVEPVIGQVHAAQLGSTHPPSTSTSPSTGVIKGATSTSTGTSTSTSKSSPQVTGLRQRVNSLSQSLDKATDHPAVQNVKVQSHKQLAQLREVLGRSPLIVRAEKRTQVDRVWLVFGGVFLYLLLIPLNFLHLAQPTTTLLTFIPPMLLALRVLDQPNEQRTRLLLSYFTVFGFVQFAESLMAGFLARRIPQYYTVKLVFLAYLIHPRTKGALKIYESVLRPALTQSRSVVSGQYDTTTPPTSKPSASTANSPTFGASKPAASSNFNATHSSTGTATNATGPTGTAFNTQSQVGETTVPSQLGQTKPFSLNESGRTGLTLPSGGGTGVGLEIPKDTHTATHAPTLEDLAAAGNVTRSAAAGEGFDVASAAHREKF